MALALVAAAAIACVGSAAELPLTLSGCGVSSTHAKSCSLPFGLGLMTFDALTFPIKNGSASAIVDLSLSTLIPVGVALTETKVKASGTGGASHFCMDSKSKPAADEFVMPVVIAAAVEITGGAQLALTWTDCGDSITTGQRASIIGTGVVDAYVSRGNLLP